MEKKFEELYEALLRESHLEGCENFRISPDFCPNCRIPPDCCSNCKDSYDLIHVIMWRASIEFDQFFSSRDAIYRIHHLDNLILLRDLLLSGGPKYRRQYELLSKAVECALEDERKRDYL